MRTLDPQAQLAGSVAKFSTRLYAPQMLQVNETTNTRIHRLQQDPTNILHPKSRIHCYNSNMREVRRTVCALDCPDACSMLVTVEDGRGTQLRGDPDHPITRGFLCAKVSRYLEREYSPDRL